MSSASFSYMANVTAYTKRNPAAVAGKVGAPVVNLASLRILPLMPTTPEILLRYRLESPREPYVTYTEGSLDVAEGDTLVIGADEYRVKGVGNWPTDRSYLEIVVDKVKGT
jgi:hypothetical protein